MTQCQNLRPIAFVFLLILCLAACAGPIEVEDGSTRLQVREALGEPDQILEFAQAEEPVGPRVNLRELVPAGTTVEEWVYEEGSVAYFVWFSGAEGTEKEVWRVVASRRIRTGPFY